MDSIFILADANIISIKELSSAFCNDDDGQNFSPHWIHLWAIISTETERE